jgi:Tol biopolymer transport system component
MAGDTARVAFAVTCGPASGTLRVAVQTTGSDIDPSGYDIVVDGGRDAAIDPAGLTLFTVPAGPHMVSLGGVNPNCTVADPLMRTAVVPVGGLASAEFAVQCATSSRAGRGHEIAFDSTDPVTEVTTVEVVNDDGSHMERLVPGIAYGHDTPAWSPDGSRFAFFAHPDEATTALVVAAADGSVEQQFPEPSPLQSSAAIAWAPDGRRLALDALEPGCASVRLVPLDGSPEQVQDIGCYSQDRLLDLDWSPDGHSLVVVPFFEADISPSFSFLELTDLDVPGSTLAPPDCGFREPTAAAWSPDGARLAVADGGIVLVDLSTGTCTRLSDEPTDDWPDWSPDGARIVFSSARDGKSEIYVMDADGSNQTRITRTVVSNRAPSWRP